MSTAPCAVVMAMSLVFAPSEGVSSREYVGVTVIDAPAAAVDAGPGETAPGAVVVPEPSADDPVVEDDLVVADDELDFDAEDDGFFDDEGDFEGDDYDPLRDSPEAIQASGWIRSGIVFSVVGGVLAIGGVLMALSDPTDLAAGNGSQELARNRAAQAMGIPGGALLAGGLAMIVVGKRKKKRLGASLEALRRGVGVGMTLRF